MKPPYRPKHRGEHSHFDYWFGNIMGFVWDWTAISFAVSFALGALVGHLG